MKLEVDYNSVLLKGGPNKDPSSAAASPRVPISTAIQFVYFLEFKKILNDFLPNRKSTSVYKPQKFLSKSLMGIFFHFKRNHPWEQGKHET